MRNATGFAFSTSFYLSCGRWRGTSEPLLCGFSVEDSHHGSMLVLPGLKQLASRWTGTLPASKWTPVVKVQDGVGSTQHYRYLDHWFDVAESSSQVEPITQDDLNDSLQEALVTRSIARLLSLIDRLSRCNDCKVMAQLIQKVSVISDEERDYMWSMDDTATIESLLQVLSSKVLTSPTCNSFWTYAAALDLSEHLLDGIRFRQNSHRSEPSDTRLWKASSVLWGRLAPEKTSEEAAAAAEASCEWSRRSKSIGWKLASLGLTFYEPSLRLFSTSTTEAIASVLDDQEGQIMLNVAKDIQVHIYSTDRSESQSAAAAALVIVYQGHHSHHCWEYSQTNTSIGSSIVDVSLGSLLDEESRAVKRVEIVWLSLPMMVQHVSMDRISCGWLDRPMDPPAWSTSGCRLIRSSIGSSTAAENQRSNASLGCECNHLTEFALLLRREIPPVARQARKAPTLEDLKTWSPALYYGSWVSFGLLFGFCTCVWLILMFRFQMLDAQSSFTSVPLVKVLVMAAATLLMGSSVLLCWGSVLVLPLLVHTESSGFVGLLSLVHFSVMLNALSILCLILHFMLDNIMSRVIATVKTGVVQQACYVPALSSPMKLLCGNLVLSFIYAVMFRGIIIRLVLSIPSWEATQIVIFGVSLRLTQGLLPGIFTFDSSETLLSGLILGSLSFTLLIWRFSVLFGSLVQVETRISRCYKILEENSVYFNSVQLMTSDTMLLRACRITSFVLVAGLSSTMRWLFSWLGGSMRWSGLLVHYAAVCSSMGCWLLLWLIVRWLSQVQPGIHSAPRKTKRRP